MDACHILLGYPWQFDKDEVYRGRRNEYKLKQNEKKIVLLLMSSAEVRSMNNKKPSFTMLVSEKEVEHVLNQGEDIFFLIMKEDPKVENEK